ncbi:MAG: galactokinase [Paludibacteraceae bacterium]|nr:galactokinase [Paludibacteraceae bacterium]
MNTYSYHIFAPYRVCPLGAHVDHQHGLVSGFAIDKGVDLWFNITQDGSVKLTSRTFPGEVNIRIDDKTRVKEGNWGDYVRGAKYALSKRFVLQHGIEGEIAGSLPIGGLSSSAAVLIAYVMAFAKANAITLTKMEVIKIASEAEREYIGLNNGILDQACIALGEQGKLLFLDTATEQYRLIEPGEDLGKYEIAIIFSGLTRNLVNSDYNLRVSECKTAAWCMQAYKDQPIKPFDQTFLRDVPYEMYEATRDRMPVRFARRAEHFYSEHKRVRKGVTAWESGNIEFFGQLVKQSCESSIHNYECGSPELIAIYTLLKDMKGVYGGRFSGAGFKGAVIALVDSAYKQEVEEQITRAYLAQYPEYKKTFGIYWVHSTDGARFIEA